MTAGKTALQVYQYEGSEITFSQGMNVMVNATEMAKPFGKQPIRWLETSQSKDYINELSKLRKRSLADLVQVKRGGDHPGTWMHEDVALEFARWLSPRFGIWCNDVVRGLVIEMCERCGFAVEHPSERYFRDCRGTEPVRGRRRKVVPRDRSEEMGAFFAELGRWVTKEDVRLVAAELGLKEGTVRSALRGTGSNLRVLELLVLLAAENRKAGRRSDYRVAGRSTELAMGQLMLTFMGEEGGAR